MRASENVWRAARHVLGGHFGRRQAAPRARRREPRLRGFERGGIDAVARRDRIDAQPFDQVRRADAAFGQREPVEQHARDRDSPATAAGP